MDPFVRVVEFKRLLRGSHTRPFQAVVRDSNGVEFDACIKPQRVGKPEITEHLFADWCGTQLGRRMGLPIPEMYIAEIDAAFLQSVAPQLDGVMAGMAVASRWEDQAFPPFAFIPKVSEITNPDAASGITTADTLIQNSDREEDLLILPDFDAPGEKFRLSFIDNGWIVWFPLPIHRAMVPRRGILRNLIHRTPCLEDFVFAAEALDFLTVEGDLAHVAGSQLETSNPSTGEYLAAVRQRSGEIRSVLLSARP